MTINDLEEQIQLLKVKIEDINERLNNLTSILQDTHLISSDLNARLIMIENELSLLKTKSSEVCIYHSRIYFSFYSLYRIIKQFVNQNKTNQSFHKAFSSNLISNQ
jgi:ethanolamine utilization cobalamin adenosyltransferase